MPCSSESTPAATAAMPPAGCWECTATRPPTACTATTPWRNTATGTGSSPGPRSPMSLAHPVAAAWAAATFGRSAWSTRWVCASTRPGSSQPSPTSSAPRTGSVVQPSPSANRSTHSPSGSARPRTRSTPIRYPSRTVSRPPRCDAERGGEGVRQRDEVVPLDDRTPQAGDAVDVDQLAAGEPGTAEVGVGELRPGEPAVDEPGPAQVGVGEVGPG